MSDRSNYKLCSCDNDPIECNHEAALGLAEEKLRQIELVCKWVEDNRQFLWGEAIVRRIREVLDV